jgi:uncharacterized protein (DUF2267 family)
MDYNEFIGKVHNRAELASTEEAVKAIRATLHTLGERVTEGEAQDLAAQLPEELGVYLNMAEKTERFALDEFLDRVAEREGIDRPVSVYHARVVMDVLMDAVTAGEAEDVLAQLPDSFRPLFEAGSEGDMAV